MVEIASRPHQLERERERERNRRFAAEKNDGSSNHNQKINYVMVQSRHSKVQSIWDETETDLNAIPKTMLIDL